MISYWNDGQTPVGLVLELSPTKLKICAYTDKSEDIANMVKGETLSPLLEGRRILVARPFEVDLDELRSRREWEDYCMWGIPLDDRNLSFRRVFNINAIANVNRVSPFWYQSLVDTLIPLRFYVPHRNADFTEMAIEVMTTKDFPLIGNMDAAELPPFAASQRVLPRLEIEGPTRLAPDQRADFQVVAKQADGRPYPKALTVHLRPSAGRVSKNWLTLEQGQGGFRVTAQDLDPGDPVEIIAGFRYTYQVTRHLITVA